MAVTALFPHSPELPTRLLGLSTPSQRPASSESSLASGTFLLLGYPLMAEAFLLCPFCCHVMWITKYCFTVSQLGDWEGRVSTGYLVVGEGCKENFHAGCSLFLANIFKMQQTSQLKDGCLLQTAMYTVQTLFSKSYALSSCYAKNTSASFPEQNVFPGPQRELGSVPCSPGDPP